MFPNDTGDRNLPASPRRRREARRQGQVWQSGDLSAALMLGGVSLLLICLGPELVTACATGLRTSLSNAPALRADQLTSTGPLQSWISVSVTAAGVLVSLWVLAIVVRLLQVGPLWAPQLAQPSWQRVSLLSGLQRMFSAATVVRGPLWGLRLMLIAGIVWWTLTDQAARIATLSQQTPADLAVSLGELITSFALRLSGGLLCVALLDVGWQWFSHEQRLRMSAAEVRDERRESSRPQLQRRRRSRPAIQAAATESIRSV